MLKRCCSAPEVLFFRRSFDLARFFMIVRLSISVVSILLISAIAAPLFAQTAPKHRKSPHEIVENSKLMAARYESCRRQANQLKLHLWKRHVFLRDCRKRRD